MYLPTAVSSLVRLLAPTVSAWLGTADPESIITLTRLRL